ncbi:MAG: DUF4143 domain-containing protein [Deltaproteobacteria bacterium]|nr:DUF4143 domain-containing protein [Deltaproteobacteria bacterium]
MAILAIFSGAPCEKLADSRKRGAIFESLVVSEFYKNFMHRWEQPSLYFWRDAAGHQVDLTVDLGTKLIPIEIKSGQTAAPTTLVVLLGTAWKGLSQPFIFINRSNQIQPES